MPKLSEIMNAIRQSADYHRAHVLAANDYKLIADLVKVRKQQGLKQRDVALLLGITQQAVSKIESHDSDPQLSTLRMYANAIGALVGHAVVADTGQLADGQHWKVTTYVVPRMNSGARSGSYVAPPSRSIDFSLAA